MFPVRAMCCAFGVSPSGFYAWHGREPSARALEDARLTQRIRHYHARPRGAYGAPNIHADLRDEGLRVGKKRVARLMRAEGLRGVCRRKWITTTVRDPEARPAPDGRASFTSRGSWTPSAVESSAGRWPSISEPSSCSPRSIWRSGSDVPRVLCITPTRARSTRRSSSAFAARKRRCVPRWERSATPTTTRCARVFFATLECELLDRRRLATKAEARMAIFEFIEGWYNPTRRHSRLGRISPMQFERRHSMHPEHAVTHRPARSVAFEAPRAQPVDNRL
jgi:putative transposase